jgi:uncharacterized protein DUF5666
MKWKSFAVGIVALLALPFTAQAASPQHHRYAGSVTAVSPSALTLDVHGTSVTLAIDSSTKVVYGKGQTSIDTGDLVRVAAAGSTAKRIHVDCNCHFAAGTVSSVASGSFVVHVLRTGPFDRVLKGNDVTFQLTSSTTAKAGDRVGVIFSATGFFRDPSFDWTKATFTAKQVRIRTAR